MTFCRRIPLKERKNVTRCDRQTKARDDESDTITSFDSFLFPSPSEGGSYQRDERYITLDNASVVPPPFDRSLIAKREDADQDDPVPRISPYRKKVPVKRPNTKSPRRKRMRCINVPRVGISFDAEKTSRLKSEFMERLQNEKRARLGKNYHPTGSVPAKVAAKPLKQVPSVEQRARAHEKNSQFFMLTASTVDGRETAEKSQDVAGECKDMISSNSFVTNNPTAAASMSSQLWTVICNSKSVSMRQLPICKARSSSKGIFYRGRRAKYKFSTEQELEFPNALNKRYKDSPQIVNAVNDWILNYDTRCDESTDTLDIAPEPKSLMHSAGAYYSSLKYSTDANHEVRSSQPVYSIGNYILQTKRSGDPHDGTAGSRDLNQLMGVRDRHLVSSIVSASGRQSPNAKHIGQRKRLNHSYHKSGRRRSSNSMGSGKIEDPREKIVYGKGAENERSNNRCESVESSACDDDTAKITETLEPDGRRQEVVVCCPFLHKAVRVACGEAALGEAVCTSTNKTLNNSNPKEDKSPQGVSQMSTVSGSPNPRFGDTYTKDGGTRKQTNVHSNGQGSCSRQTSAQSANEVNSIPISCIPLSKKAPLFQLKRQVSCPKTRAERRDTGRSFDDLLPAGPAMKKFSSASPVCIAHPHFIPHSVQLRCNQQNDDQTSPPSVKKTRIKKRVGTLPRQALHRKHIKKALCVTSIKVKASPSAPNKEKSPKVQESRKSLVGIPSDRIIPQTGDGKPDSPHKSDPADISSASIAATTTPTHSSEHQVNETFTISPKLNHWSRKKRIHVKRPAGDVSEATKKPRGDESKTTKKPMANMLEMTKKPRANMLETTKKPSADVSETTKKSGGDVSETTKSTAGVVSRTTNTPVGDEVETDSETKDYGTKSTTSCNTSNIFSIIHEIVGKKKNKKIAPPVTETTGFAEPWPTSPMVKIHTEKPPPPAPPVIKRKPLRLYKRYRIPPKKTCSAATSKVGKENATERKAPGSPRKFHRHRRLLNPTKKLTRSSAFEIKCPIRVELLSYRPARSQNGNKIVNQTGKKNVYSVRGNSSTAFSDKGVQVKRYSSDEIKTDTPTKDYYGNSLLNSEQIKSTIHKRIYSVRTTSTESIKSEAVPKHYEDFQKFIAMTRNTQRENSFEKVSNQTSPRSQGEVMDKKSSSVDGPHGSLPRRASNNELDLIGAHKPDFINTILSISDVNPSDVPEADKRVARHRHGIRMPLKMPQDNTLAEQENLYLNMLFKGGRTVSAPNQSSMSPNKKSDLSSSVDPLVYESPGEPRRLSSPRTSMPYEREELKLSIPDAFLPYIRRAREYYVISQTLLHPQYNHMMRDRVSKSKEGSAPTFLSNVNERNSISTADGSPKGSGLREKTVKSELDAPRPESKARKNLAKETTPNKKRGPPDKNKNLPTAAVKPSSAVVKQASSSPKIIIPKVSSERTVYKANITKLSAPRQVSKQFATKHAVVPVQQKKRSESTVNTVLLKNRMETTAKHSVSKERLLRGTKLIENCVLPKFDRLSSLGSEKNRPLKKSPSNKVHSESVGTKERSLKQPSQRKAKVTAPKEVSISTAGSENTLTPSSGDEKYKEPPSEAALRQRLAYLNYVKTGTRLKFPENEIQMIKYLSTSEPSLLPVGTPSALRQTRKTATSNRRSTAPLWNEKGNHTKLRKVEATPKGNTANWKSNTPSTNQKGKTQFSMTKQKKRHVRRLNKKTIGTNSTNNKYVKSSSLSQQSKVKFKSRPLSSVGTSYGSGIWQQPSNLRENLLLLSALNRCRNNSDKVSDGIKEFTTLYDHQSELSGRNVYIPKVLQNILSDREKSLAKKKPRAGSRKFGAAKRRRKVNSSLTSKHAIGKVNTKSGGNFKRVSLASRKPVTSQTITNMIKKTFAGKDVVGKSIYGLVSDLKSISETLKASPTLQGHFKLGENRPVLTRRPTGPLPDRMLGRNNTHVDSSDSTLNSSQTTGCDNELISEASDTVMKQGVSEVAVNDKLGSSMIVEGGRKIWSAAYDRVVKMLNGEKAPVEPKHKLKHKHVKEKDVISVSSQTPISGKVKKKNLTKRHVTAFEPEYLHVARETILSKANPASDPKCFALVKLGTKLGHAGSKMSNKLVERNTRSNLIKRRADKTSKEKQGRKKPVSRFHV